MKGDPKHLRLECHMPTRCGHMWDIAFSYIWDDQETIYTYLIYRKTHTSFRYIEILCFPKIINIFPLLITLTVDGRFQVRVSIELRIQTHIVKIPSFTNSISLNAFALVSIYKRERTYSQYRLYILLFLLYSSWSF